MTTQRTMFDVEAPAQSPAIPLAPVRGEAGEPTVVGTVADEKKRTGTQCDAILARLREGSATNFELTDIALRYSARICSLRKLGHVIEIVHTNNKTGLRIYRLKEGM